MLDKILVLDLGRGLAAAASTLRGIRLQRLRLGIAEMRDGHHHVFLADQVLDRQVGMIDDDFSAARIFEFFFDFLEFTPDFLFQAFVSIENVEQVLDLFENLTVLGNDLVLFQSGQFVQAQIENCLRLLLGQTILIVDQPEMIGDAFRPR